MMVPGSNLLNQAMALISKQCFYYQQFISRATNSIGQDVSTYASSVTMWGSAQPVPRQLFEAYGLDFQRRYQMFYVPQNMNDIARDVAGDLIIYGSRTYECISKTEWFAADGWISVLAVEIPSS